MSGTIGGGRLGGIAVMTINGEPWNVVDSLEWNAVTVARETMKGQSAVEGYSEMPTQCFIGAKLRDRRDVSVPALNDLTNCTVILTQANGKQVYGDGLWATEVSPVDTKEATFSVRFEGLVITEGLVG